VILGLEEIEFLLDAITRVGHGEFQLSRWRRRTLSMQNNSKNKQKKCYKYVRECKRTARKDHNRKSSFNFKRRKRKKSFLFLTIFSIVIDIVMWLLACAAIRERETTTHRRGMPRWCRVHFLLLLAQLEGRTRHALSVKITRPHGIRRSRNIDVDDEMKGGEERERKGWRE